MTDTAPGDRASGSGSGNGSGFIPALAAAIHFTDKLIAAAVGKPGWTTGPVDVGGVAPSYWYSGLQDEQEWRDKNNQNGAKSYSNKRFNNTQ